MVKNKACELSGSTVLARLSHRNGAIDRVCQSVRKRMAVGGMGGALLDIIAPFQVSALERRGRVGGGVEDACLSLSVSSQIINSLTERERSMHSACGSQRRLWWIAVFR